MWLKCCMIIVNGVAVYEQGEKILGKINRENDKISLKETKVKFKADCEKCYGLCCVALYFSALDGFPVDKEGGVPCPNLQEDYRCREHKNLTALGLKGCCGYDCFGAGPKISQDTFSCKSWKDMKKSANEMFAVYLIMRQLYEMLLYLKQARNKDATFSLWEALDFMFDETEKITNQRPEKLMELDIDAHRQRVNQFLLKASELIRKDARGENSSLKNQETLIGPGKDLMGVDLRNFDLIGANLRGAYLIGADMRRCILKGADLIGVDLRDADIRETDLSESVFLTQAQLNVAKGDSGTKIPQDMLRPGHWSI